MRRSSLALGQPERERLVAGARVFGIALDLDQVERFVRFSQLLDQWAARVNLLSCSSAVELVDRHFVDSLAAAAHLGNARVVVDLGSGAGFPGVPIAISCPGRRVMLVEVRQRRLSFLHEVKRSLRLDAIEVVEARAERGRPEGVVAAQMAMARAVWANDRILDIAPLWIEGSGGLLWMRSSKAGLDAQDHAPRAMRLSRRTVYRIAEGPERAIEIYRT